MNSLQRKIKTPLGDLYIVASEKGLQKIFWQQQAEPMENEEALEPAKKVLDLAEKQLTEYFTKSRTLFELPYDVQGTEFQKKVWAKLEKISYGETKSYKDIAVELRSDKACRAVGTANGKNPLSIVVPCHRVISSDGTLGGYSGGLDIKRKLLDLESKAD